MGLVERRGIRRAAFYAGVISLSARQRRRGYFVQRTRRKLTIIIRKVTNSDIIILGKRLIMTEDKELDFSLYFFSFIPHVCARLYRNYFIARCVKSRIKLTFSIIDVANKYKLIRCTIEIQRVASRVLASRVAR